MNSYLLRASVLALAIAAPAAAHAYQPGDFIVRAGVAPDHPSTKGVEKTFASTAAKRTFEYFLNVEIGKHINHDELLDHYGAVIYAHGASSDTRTRGSDA